MLAAYANVDAHSWFPNRCCNEGHCKKILQWKEISDDKWVIITSDGEFLIGKKELDVEPSQDDENHLCVYNGKPLCLFANIKS